MTTFSLIEDLRIGHIIEVSGTALRIELCGSVTDLMRTYEGRVYPIGQIGSIIKIHFGRRLLFGFVTLLRMRSEDYVENLQPIPVEADQRIMEVELFAEGFWNSSENALTFLRGIKTYPLPHQGAYLMTRQEIIELYTAAEGNCHGDSYNPLVPFAYYVGADNALCHANIDKMLGMHCAILGSTGTGKSGAVAALLHSIVEHKVIEGKKCHPRMIIIDPHGEYGSAFKNNALIYRAYNPLGTEETESISIKLPYWLMSADEFRRLIIGKTEQEATSQNNIIYKAITHARMVAAGLVKAAPTSYGIPIVEGKEIDAPQLENDVSEELLFNFDRDKPRPFSLDELCNHILYLQAARKKSNITEKVTETDFAKTFKSVLDKLNVLRQDPRIEFLMKNYSPEDDSVTLGKIIEQFVGEKEDGEKVKDIRILDISGLPNEVAGPLTAMLARLLFQYKVYQTDAERSRDPIVLVCEEAHRYVPDRGEAEYMAAQSSIRRIAREGRKYGIGLMLVSQRPADVESTVMAQCGTWIILRLTNAADQNHVARFLPDGLTGMTKILPNLAQQEAIFVGEGAAMPARIRIRDLNKEQLPRSETAKFAQGWILQRLSEEELKTVAKRMVT